MLTALVESVAVAIVALITSRDDLYARLRQARQAPGVPLATEAVAMIASYLTVERDRCRRRHDRADRGRTPAVRRPLPETGAARKVVTTVPAGVAQEPQP